ncbi:uncharacterized protein TNIN_461901 [Trichonephila inaurata madagascariensis]|uniref:Uncharacterized protein n=1 Tax=Trichonephila inaurata madagascariensis TaxID=2747483 RepID=A0A8X6IQQ2_9ARAC|nr:uncharacterized protein TNIN_461901 [Trichonephila inaurata madagascariensis]
MAENMTDFHILLPSNSSMKVSPLNTPDHFRTKLARPITLNGEKCDVSSSILVGHEKALEQSLVQMPFTRIETKTFTLSSGLKSVIIPNAVNGTLPSRMILGLVSNSIYLM